MTASPTGMDTLFAIITLRAIREYTADPIPDDILQRILQAGRATGSASNRQNWLFYVVRNREVLAKLAQTVYEPDNILGCQVAIAIALTSKQSFDAGRVAQNMSLAAHAAGLGSCPNGIHDIKTTREALGVDEDIAIPTILSLGYPKKPLKLRDHDIDAILSRINRKPLDEIVRNID